MAGEDGDQPRRDEARPPVPQPRAQVVNARDQREASDDIEYASGDDVIAREEEDRGQRGRIAGRRRRGWGALRRIGFERDKALPFREVLRRVVVDDRIVEAAVARIRLHRDDPHNSQRQRDDEDRRQPAHVAVRPQAGESPQRNTKLAARGLQRPRERRALRAFRRSRCSFATSHRYALCR